MTDLFPERVTLACPLCGSPIQAQVHNLIDVGQEPELKDMLLHGRINVARCPNCSGEGVIATPIVYHDPEKELLLAFTPPEAGLKDEEQQRVIGDLTNLIMSYLPPEKRKGYLLLPKILLTYQSLLEEVLKADGITAEVIAAQQARIELIERLREAMGDEEKLQAAVDEVDDQLDYEFFAVLAATIEASRQDARGERARTRARELEDLRGELLERSTFGRRWAAQVLAGPEEVSSLERGELLERLLAAESEEELVELVSWYRAGVDYTFFQMLTERMEAAEQEGDEAGAQRLSELRSTLLEATERLDRETQAALEEAAGLLRRLAAADDPDAFIRERLDRFDDAFFIVLGANLQAAEETGQTAQRERLQELGRRVLEIAEEGLPPEMRLLRRLLAAPDDEAARALLEEQDQASREHLRSLVLEMAQEISEGPVADRLKELIGLIEGSIQRSTAHT